MTITTAGALRAVAVLALAGSAAACATVTRGSNTAWEVQTTPSGARVATSNGMFCDSTPCAIKMPRKSQFTATITKPGYKEAKVSVTNKVSGAGGAGMAGNVLLGGVIGAGVDVASGAMLDLTPNPAVVVLEKDEPTPAVATATPDASAAAVSAAPAAGSGDDQAATAADEEVGKG